MIHEGKFCRRLVRKKKHIENIRQYLFYNVDGPVKVCYKGLFTVKVKLIKSGTVSKLGTEYNAGMLQAPHNQC